MSFQPVLALPSLSPSSVAQYRHLSLEFRPVALYTLLSLSSTELSTIRDTCEASCNLSLPGDAVHLAPRHDFSGETLRAIFDYHLELAKGTAYKQTLFIVLVEQGWKENGVLLVCIDTMEEDEVEGKATCKVDSFRTQAKDSGLICVNINIGNSDWYEEKENYEIKSDTGLRDSDKACDPFDADSPPPKWPPPFGHYIGIYLIPGLDPVSTIQTLEVAHTLKKPANYILRLQGILPSTTILNKSLDLHPSRCKINPFLHPFFYFVIDSVDPATDGVLLCSFGGQIKTNAMPERASKRIPFYERTGFQDEFCLVYLGLKGW